jgi:GT2 family glycosyltransferase/glycosyltransferase involved in cell wall biosynthesis
VRLYLIWAAVVPAGVRLRIRYATQLGSWLMRPTPTRLGWVRAYFSLRRSGAFDYHYYAHRYPEVVRRRMNPLMHYIEHGAREGRDPSARFSTSAYLARRPELDPRRRNPLFEANRRGEVGFASPDAVATVAPLASTLGSVAVTVEPEGPAGDDEAPARPRPPADWRLPSITGVDIICLPIIDWHYRFQRPQQLATQFAAAGHRVFYAETKFHDRGDALHVDPLADGVWSVGLPGPGEKVIYTSTLDEAELERLLSALDAFRRVASISHAVVVVDLPFWAPLALEAARRFGWRVIYDCMDHHAGFLDDGFGSAAVRIAIEENEEALLHDSDAVLTTSRLLDERIRPIARKSVLLPNATDFEHFNKRPAELAVDESLERPVIGYYGAISSWFDVELVEAAARARPHWSFVLVGSTFGADVNALETLPNVHFPGERPYAEIPSYLHAFDVACIPFKLNALTQATNPVKFYEYLSAGKPIVASALPELEPYEGYYYPARTATEFLAQVENALHENVPAQASSKRIALALNNTWSARWKDLARLLRSWFGPVAIVVLSYDNPEYLRQCLESIWENTRYPSYDVYVVENGSNPEIDAYLTAESETRERLHVIRPGANLGFARANNLAVELAGDCEYVVLLNDDVVVTDGWLRTLLRHLEDDTVGIVGPVTNWTGNEARVDVDYEGLEGMDEFAARHTAERTGKTFDITSLAMYCVAIRRRLYDSLGRLDERFEVGMFEDDDFAQRVRDAGLRVVCAEDVFIHHWGRASFSRMDQEQYNAVFEANRRRFEEKWGRAWEPHRSR